MATSHHTLDRSSLDELETLHSAYLGLEVLAGVADIDSIHVANLLNILNRVFQDRIEGLSKPACSGRSVS